MSELGWSVRVLGRFEVARGGEPVPVRPSAQRLIALAAINGPVDRVDAAYRLWPDGSGAQALGNLRTVLWHLRREAHGLVEEGRSRLHLHGASVDLVGIRSWSDRVLRGGDPGWALPPRVGTELLPGWSDEWLIPPREETRQVQLHALEAAARYSLSAGRHAEALTRAWTATAADPLRESAVRLLIEIHLVEGNTGEALRHYRDFTALLRRELDATPSSRLQALMAQYGLTT